MDTIIARVDRRAVVRTVLLAVLPVGGAACVTPQQPPTAGGLRLVFQPTRVFKASDLPREGTESWFVTVAAESNSEAALTLSGLETKLFSGEREAETTRYSPETVRDIAILAPPRAPGAPPSPVYRPFGFRLIGRERASLAIDRMRVTVRVLDEAGRPIELARDIPLETYVQRSGLIFPFQGPGIVTQGGAANAGHRNRSGQFAIDAMGLSPNYAVQVGDTFATNTDLVGFGRSLLAPAAGVVVEVRGDRPDQPVPGVSDEAYHLPEFRGSGDPGNHVVIDHGNGEFSMVAHIKAGSVMPAAGQSITQGQPIGQLGNSGDSNSPHVHYQLQDGPNWQTANALPCRFNNVAADPLVRGVFFTAR